MSQPMNPNASLHQMIPTNPNQMMPLPTNQNPSVPTMPPANMAQLGGMVPGNIPGPGPNMVSINPNAPMNNPQIQQSGLSNNPAVASAPAQQVQPPIDQNLARLKTLVAQLKKSMHDLMEIAGGNINHNSNIDNGIPHKNEDSPHRFDKALEDFYSICNQLELCLRTILECAIQTRDSSSYLPFQVLKDLQTDIIPPTMVNDNSLNYHQYLSLIKKQVIYAKSVYDALSDTVKQIKSEQPIMQQQLNQVNPAIQQQQQQQQPNMS